MVQVEPQQIVLAFKVGRRNERAAGGHAVIGAHRGAVGESSDVGVTKFTATPYADIGGQAPVSGMPGTDVPTTTNISIWHAMATSAGYERPCSSETIVFISRCETRHRPTARAEAPRSFDRLRTRDGFRCSLPGREWPVSSVPAMTNGCPGIMIGWASIRVNCLESTGRSGAIKRFPVLPDGIPRVWAALFGATSRSSRKLRAPRTRAACFSQLSRSVRYRGRAARIAHTSAAPSRSTYFTTPVTALAGDELVNGLPQVGKPPPSIASRTHICSSDSFSRSSSGSSVAISRWR